MCVCVCVCVWYVYVYVYVYVLILSASHVLTLPVELGLERGLRGVRVGRPWRTLVIPARAVPRCLKNKHSTHTLSYPVEPMSRLHKKIQYKVASAPQGRERERERDFIRNHVQNGCSWARSDLHHPVGRTDPNTYPGLSARSAQRPTW
jgi:hypothetical protein